MTIFGQEYCTGDAVCGLLHYIPKHFLSALPAVHDVKLDYLVRWVSTGFSNEKGLFPLVVSM